MPREQRKDILEVIGVVAIVASLVFLGIEMRTNTSNVRSAANQTWVSVNADLNSVDEKLARALATGFYEPGKLSEDNYMQFALWHYTFYQMAQSTDDMYQMGAVGEDLWKREINRAAGHLDLPGVRQWWNAGARTQFSPDFVELMKSTNSDISRWSWVPEVGFVPEDPLLLTSGE